MKTEVSKKLETVTNLVIIVVAIILGFVLIQKYFRSENPEKMPTEIVKGTKVSLPDVSWRQNQKTLLLVLQKNCRFCSESMPFYKTLVEKSKVKGVQLIAVLPDSREEGVQYLKENGVDIQEIRQSRINEINVQGTPTLILLNDKGEVENSWVGKLPSEKETEVIENL
jgi:thioredoxin-related protein